MNPEENNQQQLSIELPQEVANGIYSNLAIVGFGNNEFVLDFLSLLPGKSPVKVDSRIVMTPENLKRLSRMLQHHLSLFEQENGTIELPEDKAENAGIPQAQA